MKIAAITLTRNDDFRLVPWKMYFKDYKDELYEHIVVDNGSTPEYQRKLREAFPDSTHIELGYNGGCTGAYRIVGNAVVDEISVMLFKILKSIPSCSSAMI